MINTRSNSLTNYGSQITINPVFMSLEDRGKSQELRGMRNSPQKRPWNYVNHGLTVQTCIILGLWWHQGPSGVLIFNHIPLILGWKWLEIWENERFVFKVLNLHKRPISSLGPLDKTLMSMATVIYMLLMSLWVGKKLFWNKKTAVSYVFLCSLLHIIINFV